MHFNIFWKAIYKDKNKKQHSSKTHDKYSDIDRSDLEAVEVYLGDNLIHTLVLEENQRLIMRYRVQQDAYNPHKSSYVFLIGWQKTENEKNTQEITYIYPDGKKEISGKWDNSKALYSKPNLRPEER